jgi:hypothetical protein
LGAENQLPQWLGKEYCNFGEYFCLGKKRSGLKSPIRQKKGVFLKNTSVVKQKVQF